MSTGEVMAVAGCGSAKKDGVHPARELYTSNYFALKRQYAESVATGWVVLSAKYGVVEPDQEIRTYNVTVSDLDDGELREWAASAYAEIEERAAFMYPKEECCIVWLAGEKYVEPVMQVAERRDGFPVRCRFPFRHTEGIGEQMAWLKQQIRQNNAQQSTLERMVRP